LTHPIITLRVEDFSRWFIQLIRPRVWIEGEDKLKIATYITLLRVIEKSAKIIAPFAPFLAEFIYQRFVKEFKEGEESIFMESYPEPDDDLIDEDLERAMNMILFHRLQGQLVQTLDPRKDPSVFKIFEHL